MAKSVKEKPTAQRSASEIEFVLRRAKWRRGPEVLRDLARAEADLPSRSEEKKRRAPRRGDG